jgi:hypothetical protein
MKKIIFFVFVFSALFLTGCGSAFQFVQMNADDQRVSPSIDIDKSSVTTSVPFPKLDSMKFVYMIGSASNLEGSNYSVMMNDFFKQLGLSIVNQDQLIAKIADNKLDTVITNLQDKMQLRKLSKLIGPFLVINTSCLWLGSSWWKHWVFIYDPEEPKTLLEISYRRMAWVSVKKEVVNPVLNEIIDWTNKSRAAAMKQ